MHADEVDVPADLVRRLLELRFPQWAQLPLAEVPSHGTDARLYRLGAELLVRLPNINWAAGQIPFERQLLPRLAPRLPVELPEIVAVAEPALDYPWTWAVYRWIDGQPPTAGSARLAHDLARFIAALQSIDTSGGLPGRARGGPLELRDAATRTALAQLTDQIDVAAASEAWERALATPAWPHAPVWLHGDLLEGNLLLRERRLAAVIDWSSASVGDPAFDYTIAWSLLSPVRDIFRTATRVDADTWSRARGLALSQAVIALPYYRDTTPQIAARSRHIIHEVIADTTRPFDRPIE